MWLTIFWFSPTFINAILANIFFLSLRSLSFAFLRFQTPTAPSKLIFFPPKLGFGLSTCPSAICLSWVTSFKELWNQRVSGPPTDLNRSFRPEQARCWRRKANLDIAMKLKIVRLVKISLPLQLGHFILILRAIFLFSSSTFGHFKQYFHKIIFFFKSHWVDSAKF